ncbi:MAG: transporter [Polyangiaceae bacterium]|nr:transporter [Polyangiaceae bacterium]
MTSFLASIAAEAPRKTPLETALDSTGAVLAVLVILIVMAVMGWVIAILKALQLGRMRSALHRFEKEVFNLLDAKDLFAVAQRSTDSPGGRVVLALSRRGGSEKVLESMAKRAVVEEQQRGGRMLTVLASIASSAPFIGLFGTVWGILQTFWVIGESGETSLDKIGPAISEALIATAVGLLAAIPALIFYNLLNRRLEDLISELEAATDAWVHLVAESDQRLAVAADKTIAQSRVGSQPPAYQSYAGG